MSLSRRQQASEGSKQEPLALPARCSAGSRRPLNSRMVMAKAQDERTQLPKHGADVLPSVRVDSYNLEVEDDEGFVGDRANKDAFWAIFDKWRKPLRELGQ